MIPLFSHYLAAMVFVQYRLPDVLSVICGRHVHDPVALNPHFAELDAYFVDWINAQKLSPTIQKVGDPLLHRYIRSLSSKVVDRSSNALARLSYESAYDARPASGLPGVHGLVLRYGGFNVCTLLFIYLSRR